MLHSSSVDSGTIQKNTICFCGYVPRLKGEGDWVELAIAKSGEGIYVPIYILSGSNSWSIVHANNLSVACLLGCLSLWGDGNLLSCNARNSKVLRDGAIKLHNWSLFVFKMSALYFYDEFLGVGGFLENISQQALSRAHGLEIKGRNGKIS